MMGLPRRWQTWTRVIEKDLKCTQHWPLNTAWQRAQDRQNWRKTVETAKWGLPLEDDSEIIPYIILNTLRLQVNSE